MAGGVLAQQSGSLAKPAVAISRPKVEAKSKLMVDWRDKLDLRRAQLDGHRLVQTLSDKTQVNYTLDPDLQQWALTYMQGHELPYGAMVLYELEQGKVLVMAGHSTRDPETPSEDLCLTPWAPAASVFKLVTASALMENGVPATTQVCYHGGLRGLRRHHLKDNPNLDTTCNSLSYAVSKSVNPIMAKLALRYLDQRTLHRWSRRFGFNRAIPFELAVQPSKARIPASDLELAQVAAGFWHTEASVLHGAVIGGVAGAQGMLRWPRMVESVVRPDGKVEIPEPPAPERVVSRRTAAALAEAMVNTTRIGTGRRGFYSRRGKPFLSGIVVGGKTGSLSRKNPFIHYNWFVGFAPASKPKVAFAVLLGNPPRWQIKAHTAGRMLLSRYFNSRKTPEPVVKKGNPAKTIARR